jgi:DNA-binding MarR family transcriptional regulator
MQSPLLDPRPATRLVESAGPSAAFDGQLTEVVTRLRRALRASIRSDYAWETLPMTHIEVLQTLADQPGIRVGDVASALRLAQSTVSALIRQMSADGLVERTTSVADRRVVLVSLTRAGVELLAEWQQAHRMRIAAALEALRLDQRDAIGQALPALDLLVDELSVH